MHSRIRQEKSHALEAQAERGGDDRLSCHGQVMQRVLESQWKADDEDRRTHLDLVELPDQVIGRKRLQRKCRGKRRTVQLHDRDVDAACRIAALAPYRFSVFEKRNRVPRYPDGVVRVHVQFDQKTVRMMIAGLVLQHMPGGHQVQPGIAFEKDTGGIGFLFPVQYGRDAGHGQQ